MEVDRRTDSSTTLTFRDADPTKARVFLQRLYDESDRLLRDEKQRAHTAMRDYVSQQLADAATIEQRAVLTQLWGREETQMLLLASGDPVGAQIIDDTRVSNLPSGAKRTLLVAGLALVMIIVIIRTALESLGRIRRVTYTSGSATGCGLRGSERSEAFSRRSYAS